jgi:hypothetical protein
MLSIIKPTTISFSKEQTCASKCGLGLRLLLNICCDLKFKTPGTATIAVIRPIMTYKQYSYLMLSAPNIQPASQEVLCGQRDVTKNCLATENISSLANFWSRIYQTQPPLGGMICMLALLSF